MKNITFLLAFGVLFLGACSNKQKDSATQGTEAVQVKVAEVTRQIVPQRAEFTGNIEPDVKNNISSAAAQRVERIYVEVGSRVHRGQLLVQMEDVNYSQARTQLANLKVDLSRIEALYKAGGVARQQYDQIRTQVEVGETNLANLAKNTKLLSPINGVVTERNFDNGDLATGKPILVVMQIQPVKILINISEEFFPKVRIGTPVKIQVDVYGEKEYQGKVSLIYPTVDPATRTFQAQVTIANGNSELRPGMYAKASVDFGSKEKVVVPDKAVIKQTGTNDRYVYVLKGDVVSYTKVQIGKKVGDIYEINNGVTLGEKVVIAGLSRLTDKAKVKVVETGFDLTK